MELRIRDVEPSEVRTAGRVVDRHQLLVVEDGGVDRPVRRVIRDHECRLLRRAPRSPTIDRLPYLDLRCRRRGEVAEGREVEGVVAEAVGDRGIGGEAPSAVEAELRILPLARPGLPAVGGGPDPEPVTGVVVGCRHGVHRVVEALGDRRLVLRERRIAVTVHLHVVESRRSDLHDRPGEGLGDHEAARRLRSALAHTVGDPAVPMLHVLDPSRDLVGRGAVPNQRSDHQRGKCGGREQARRSVLPHRFPLPTRTEAITPARRRRVNGPKVGCRGRLRTPSYTRERWRTGRSGSGHPD